QRRYLDYERFEMSSRSHSALLEYLSGIQDLRLYAAEESCHKKWNAVQQRLAALNSRMAAWDQTGQVAGTIISALTTLLITLSACMNVLAGTMSLGRFFAVQFIIGQLNAPLAQSIDILRRWQDARLTLERIGNVHLHRDEWTGTRGVDRAGADVQVTKVCFGYGGSSLRKVLKGVSFKLHKGKTTALVGPSGSGKTTLLKLLLGFYPPDDGEITIGGINLQSITPAAWRSQCGVVMQDGFLFSATIAKNIALGCEKWDSERLSKVLQIAQLEGLIASLPRGVETEVGPEGIGLSRGQVLRILIARALYNDPEYLFFDEATSALDAETEAAVVAGIKAATRGKTVMIIAHRLSTVRDADQIIVLDDGRTDEMGSHGALVAQRGNYYRLVRDQLELNS
ncbi:MAG TPA: ABC transporter ATP-binding protein, partial [Candidatus Dormibacteraeota bacterium]|nr:ABC transporter ATP-binding protein [Candidatus Dormibacteraeota bacterium]